MGMWMPAAVAASSTSVFLGTRISRPSMLTPTSPSSGGVCGGVVSVIRLRRHRRAVARLHRALAGAAVRLELLAEGLEGRHHEPGGGVAQRAEALAVHVVADVG